VACMLRLHPGDRKTAVEGLKTLEPCVERSGGFLKVKPSLEGRLGAAHCEALLTGYATAALVANKSDIAREAVRSLEKQYKGAAGVLLLQAALMARDGKVKEASALLESAAAATGAGAPLGPQLMRAQLAAQAGDAQAAAAVLASLPAAQAGRPAVLATRVALLEQAGNSEAAAAVLESALKTSNDGAAQRWALRHLARLDVERGAYDAAADRLQRLIELSPEEVEDPELLSLLPRLVAVSKPDAARALAAKLPAPPQLPAATVDGLESSGALAGAATRRAEDAQAAVAVPGSKRKSDIDGAEKKEKRKRRRKKRYPKGFDPANPGPLPDPERWLPKWQRADAKKARKKRKDKDMVKGSQGAGKVDSSLDKSGPAAAPAAASAPAKPSGKKKGKGKR